MLRNNCALLKYIFIHYFKQLFVLLIMYQHQVSSLRATMDEAVMVYDMNVEGLANWRLKNSLSDCIYQNDETSLRLAMCEIKTFEEMYTGRTVSYFSLS